MGLVANEAEAAGVPLKVLPPIREILNGRPSVSGVRDLRIEDLLGRTQARADVARSAASSVVAVLTPGRRPDRLGDRPPGRRPGT